MIFSDAPRFAATLRPRWVLGWLGAVFIAAMTAHAAYDIHRHRGEVIDGVQRDLEAQARVIAEQTARSVQAIDLVLGHLATTIGEAGATAERDRMHRLLKVQAAGLVQVEGLALFDASGAIHAASNLPVAELPGVSFASADFFAKLREDASADLVIGNAQISPGGPRWIFPLARRLPAADGRFAGVIGAAGRNEYFQRFYRETFPDPSTRISLVHRSGWLLARNPPADAMLGKPLDVVAQLLPPGGEEQSKVTRIPSPVDGIDHFVALRVVPDYPLVVAVSRDAAAALASWRNQSWATALRTLALGTFAGSLLWAALRLLGRAQVDRAALEASEERYALAMTGTGEGHWLWDIPAGKVYISDKLAEIFSFPGGAGVLRDQDYFDSLPLHPEDRERVHHNRNDHLAGRTARLDHEFRIVLPESGQVRWVRTRAQCFRDAAGQPRRMAGSTVDVTERRRADDALRESEERYMLAMAGSRGGHWVYDTGTDSLFVSPKLNEMFGLDPKTPAASRGDYFQKIPIHPEDQHIQAAMAERMLSGKAERAEFECRILLAQGTRWMLTRAQRFADPERGIVRVAGVSIDITERKEAELERQRLSDQLRQAQKLEAIGTLAGGIAHDFNNILSAILGYGELAQRASEEGSAQRRHIDASLSAGQRAKSLVERILSFSRSGMGQRVPVHVASVVSEALDGLLPTLPTNIELVRSVLAPGTGVVGDPTQVHQVVLNLCANAIQAMRNGGRLEVTLDECSLTEPLTVLTSVLAPGPHLRLQVKDSGSGIPPDLLRRIFDPFFTTKEVGVGTGLGLSLVHGIVTDLGGGIAVQSAVEHGSCFTIYLPATPATNPAKPGGAEPVPLGQGQTVLLVDDEEPLVRLGEELLAELGYEPLGFVRSSDALEAFAAQPSRYDIVLSDESMPGLSGSDFCRQVRSIRGDVPIILMSGYVTPALVEAARSFGASAVLSKPLASEAIAVALARALGVLRAPSA
jgi:PAS domain S-box-containing protein